jgi:glyoxylase-like metal-dependent hydrolase (beta-lactamase superfamily II)
VYQTRWQAERDNYGTIPGHDDLEDADCAQPVTLKDARLQPVPGFPGLAMMAAGGHTPGSTIFIARVGETTWVLSGDITNLLVSLEENRPKALIYSVLVVPENREHLESLRLWLRDLDSEPNTIVVPSHDLAALESTGMQAFATLTH